MIGKRTGSKQGSKVRLAKLAPIVTQPASLQPSSYLQPVEDLEQNSCCSVDFTAWYRPLVDNRKWKVGRIVEVGPRQLKLEALRLSTLSSPTKNQPDSSDVFMALGMPLFLHLVVRKDKSENFITVCGKVSLKIAATNDKGLPVMLYEVELEEGTVLTPYAELVQGLLSDKMACSEAAEQASEEQLADQAV